jgi:pimeloyl-ACP methyl ester carboxylesterase
MKTPVVLLHAFPLNGRMWEDQRSVLGDRRVLTPDFPGFRAHPPGPDSLEAFAEEVVAEMDRSGVGRAIVVGLSMGGYVAFRLHARWPERVHALVLADTRAGADGEEARQRRTDQAERASAEGIGWLPDAMLPGLLGAKTRAERPEVEGRVRELIAEAHPEGVARALVAMRDRPDSTPELEQIHVPVLVIVGEEDSLTPVSESQVIADGVGEGRLVVLPGVGHLSNLEDPKGFNDALASFLSEGGSGT